MGLSPSVGGFKAGLEINLCVHLPLWMVDAETYQLLTRAQLFTKINLDQSD